MSRGFLKPIPDWLALRVACVMLSSVRPRKSRSKDRCPNFIANRRCTLFLHDCVAVNPQDVVDTVDAQTLSEEGALCLWILAELNAPMHCSDDICLAEELVRDELPRPNSDFERDATVGDCRGFSHAPHVASSPLGWRCIQVVHVVDHFRFQWIPLCNDPGMICQASVSLQRAAGHEHQWAFPAHQAGNLQIPATWPRAPLGVDVLLQSGSRQSKERCQLPAGWQCFQAPPLPPCPDSGCTAKDRQRLLALHLGPSALAEVLSVRQETRSNVSTRLLLCALGETAPLPLCALGETAPPPRALPAIRSSQCSFSRRH